MDEVEDNRFRSAIGQVAHALKLEIVKCPSGLRRGDSSSRAAAARESRASQVFGDSLVAVTPKWMRSRLDAPLIGG